jgi:hypothetical protein
LSAAAILGPTPGSSVTGTARSSGRVVLRGKSCSGHNPEVLPAEASRALALEEGHAISSRSDVRTDDSPDLRGKATLPQCLTKLGQRLRCIDMPVG